MSFIELYYLIGRLNKDINNKKFRNINVFLWFINAGHSSNRRGKSSLSRLQQLQIGLTDDLLNLLFEVCNIYVPVIILHLVIPFLTSDTVESREDHSEWV